MRPWGEVQGRQPPSCRLTAPHRVRGVNAVRPVEAAALHATKQHRANVIQHNAGIMRTLAGWQRRRTRPAARGSVRTIRIMSGAPRSAHQSVQRKASLALRSAVSGGAVLAPAVTAIPAAPVLFCGGVIVWQSVKGLSAGGLRLKDFMPPGVVWLRRLVPRKRPRVTRSRLASFRCPPRSGMVMQRPAPVRQRCPETVPSLADSLPPRTRRPAPWPRHAAGGGWRHPSRGAGNGLSGKRNDRFVVVVIW